MREPVFRGVTRGVHRHGHSGHDKRCDRKSCLAPDVFVTFDLDGPVGQSYKIWEVGKPPRIVWSSARRARPRGTASRSATKCVGVGILAGCPPRPDAQGRRQGFRLEDWSYESLPTKCPKSQNPWNSLSRQCLQRSNPLSQRSNPL